MTRKTVTKGSQKNKRCRIFLIGIFRTFQVERSLLTKKITSWLGANTKYGKFQIVYFWWPLPHKKLTRQNPVIPPIKEGEELVEILDSLRTNVGNIRIERKAIFCEIIKWPIIFHFNYINRLNTRNQGSRSEIVPSAYQSVGWSWEYHGIVWGEFSFLSSQQMASNLRCEERGPAHWPPSSNTNPVWYL